VPGLARFEHLKNGRGPASSHLAAFHNFILKISDSELHEITFNRAKEEPVAASFPGVVLLFYQNDLWTASTKSMPPPASIHLTQICRMLPLDRGGASIERLAAGETERFQSEAFSGTAEGA
jgi:hypothetical protein